MGYKPIPRLRPSRRVDPSWIAALVELKDKDLITMEDYTRKTPMESFVLWFLYKASLRTVTKKQFPVKRHRVEVRHVQRRFRAQVHDWWVVEKFRSSLVAVNADRAQ